MSDRRAPSGDSDGSGDLEHAAREVRVQGAKRHASAEGHEVGRERREKDGEHVYLRVCGRARI